MYRFVKAAADLVLSSSNIQASTLLGETSRGLHSSLLRLQDQSVQSTEEFDAKEPNKETKYRIYHDNVTLVGDVASEAFPLYRDGELSGYKLKIMIKKQMRDSSGNVKEISNHHEVACYLNRYFPLLTKKLKINDRVVIHGSLANAASRTADEVTFRTVVRIANIFSIVKE